MMTTKVRRGTTNGNLRGNTKDRQSRRRWLVATFRANRDLTESGYATRFGGGTPSCRCYRCGELLVESTVTVDRIVPGCRGGTYRRDNIRPACANCNSETGAVTRRSRS
jgi:5-methylcytosine-specific restriction endonuclease McrA